MDIFDMILDAVLDSVKLIPFLFLTYLVMEYLEHKTGEGARRLMIRIGKNGRKRFHGTDAGKRIRAKSALGQGNEGENREQDGRTGRNLGQGLPGTDLAEENGRWGYGGLGAGPIVGGLLGVVPQCGFSAAASSLYAGRIITLGTLLAIYLSTSDEMLPLLLSERAPVDMIAGILLVKAVVGMAVGLGVDLLRSRKGIREQERIHDICEQEKCHCEKGILRSALSHTFQIAFFIFVVTFALNLVLQVTGEDVLANLILDRPVLAPVLAGVVGLIPNCAGSVVLTQLYLKGTMGVGALMAGLFANSGVGLLVLFRVNHDRKENLKILGILYGIGVVAGILIGIAAGR